MAKIDLTLRRVQTEDRAQAVELMHELRITIGGLQDRALYRAMCSSPEICCVVARHKDTLAGIALVELHRKWIRRRPFLAARMVIARLRRHPSQTASTSGEPKPARTPEFPLAKNPPMHWSDSAPRVLFIGVAPAWRGQGVGKQLYNAMFEEIRAMGQSCILARVALDNVASLRLHNETGWTLYEDEGVVFAIKDLQTAPSRP